MTLTTANSRAYYRERTAEHEKSPLNEVASYYTFICPECKNRRPVKGRVSRGWKAGFRCACCNEEKSAALSAGKEKPPSQDCSPRVASIIQEKV